MQSYPYRDSHVKDKTVSPTVLSLTWESPYLGKTVFILRRGPGATTSMHQAEIISKVTLTHYTSYFNPHWQDLTQPLIGKWAQVIRRHNTDVHDRQSLAIEFQCPASNQCEGMVWNANTYLLFYMFSPKISTKGFNSLWCSDVIWWYKHGSTLVQVMAQHLMAPTHYLYQYGLITNTWEQICISFSRNQSRI